MVKICIKEGGGVQYQATQDSRLKRCISAFPKSHKAACARFFGLTSKIELRAAVMRCLLRLFALPQFLTSITYIFLLR